MAAEAELRRAGAKKLGGGLGGAPAVKAKRETPKRRVPKTKSKKQPGRAGKT